LEPTSLPEDPDTRKRVSRNNPESEWIIQDVPELRIIDQDVWDAVKAQQQKLAYAAPAPGENTLNERPRPCRPNEMRALRERLHLNLEGSARLCRGPQQGHLQQPAEDQEGYA
jgi:hypothetical protein